LQTFLELDKLLFTLINGLSGPPFFDAFMVAISSNEFWILTSLVWAGYLLFKYRSKGFKQIFILAIALGATDFIAFQALKPTFRRLRPCYTIDSVQLVKEHCGGDFGFPSNHAANGGAILAFVRRSYQRKTIIVTVILVFIVNFSRIYLGVHYPLDVIAGSLFGYFLSHFIVGQFLDYKKMRPSS